MTTRVVRNEYDINDLVALLRNRSLPVTVSIAKGEKRSLRQNSTQRLWMREAEEQGDQTAEEYRGMCKLHCGVPLMRNEDPEFREAYDKVIKPMRYDHKLLAMQEPLDFPVTRLMSVEQKSRYLDAVHKFLGEQGIALTVPEEA